VRPLSAAPALTVLSSREASIFACFTEVVVAPQGVLPPVTETDAVASFDAGLVAAPAVNRLGLRAMILLVEVAPLLLRGLPRRARLRRLTPVERTAAIAALDHHPALAPLVKALRGVAHLSYYGDHDVMATLGFDADGIVSRAADLRAKEARW